MALSLLEMPSVCAVRTYYNTPFARRCVRAHLLLLSCGDHGTARCGALNGHGPMDNTCALRLMDMDHTVYIRCGLGSMAWMNDGNLTASAARPPSWTPTMAAEPAPSAMSSRTVEVQTNVVRDDDAVRVRRRRGGAGSSTLYGLVDAARVRGVPEALTGFTSAFKGEAASSCAQLGRRRRRWVLPVWHYRADVGGRGAFRHAYRRDQSLRDGAARPANDSRVGSAATAGAAARSFDGD